MQVLKFGGSSVENAGNMLRVADIIKSASITAPTVVVISALGGVTDRLIRLAETAALGENYSEALESFTQRHLDMVTGMIPVAHQSPVLSMVKILCNEIGELVYGVQLLSEFTNRSKDKIISYGEILSTKILSATLAALNLPNTWIDAREIIRTDSQYGKANADLAETYEAVRQRLDFSDTSLYIVPGFIGSNKEGITTTLGRGGSDFTGALIAAALEAKVFEIWTDVSGMMTADPRLVQNKKIIPVISYQEAMELSHFGAKVIYPPTILPVMHQNIPVKIKNTFSPEDEGTLIHNQEKENAGSISGISSINNIALISLEGSGMIGIPGFSKRLFEALAVANINVILITQSSSEFSICAGIEAASAETARNILNEAFAYEISAGKLEPLIVEKDLSIAALVGDNMKNHSGISGKMFSALGRNGINIRAISQGSSERNISVVINTADVKKAINVLHEDFFETTFKQVNLFITGAGNVGKKLIEQLVQQLPYLRKTMSLDIKVVALANSRTMYQDDEGMSLLDWQQLLENGIAFSLEDFTNYIKNKNLRNSVFVDVTANENVAAIYGSLLEKSIAVVACNKIAASGTYDHYKKLKDLSAEYSAPFLFETNVGAGLPVITTLNDQVRSGDSINKIEAVLSGTLNYVFNHYDGTVPFHEIVRQAQAEGYTEPDPRLDLSGKDVMRKILILARETGAHMEMEDIANAGFLPESCMQGNVEDFYASMAKEEAHFKKLVEAALKNGTKLKFVASFDKGSASVGLQQVGPTHDFYHLYGKDNIVLFYTNRYVEQPLVVKGAGAGAEVTAAGVFADIIRASAR